MENNKHITISFLSLVMLCGLVLFNGAALAASKKPNILVVWGDDIGHDNISVYHRGMMGGSTPNIDRIANEGVLIETSMKCFSI